MFNVLQFCLKEEIHKLEMDRLIKPYVKVKKEHEWKDIDQKVVSFYYFRF